MIHFIVGTKAQLIKTAPVMRVLRELGASYQFISTGQHRDTMSDLLANFGLPGPDHRLYDGPDITGITQMLGWSIRILWHSLRKRQALFGEDRNGLVVVHGDTFSTLLGALVGRLCGLRVAHLEAGLRSFDLFNPFPEELTRRLVFNLAQIYYCPDARAMAQLSAHCGTKLDTQGNTLYDALQLALGQCQTTPSSDQESAGAGASDGFGVVTLHRFENFRDQAATLRMVELIERIARRSPLEFILHKPTENALRRFDLLGRLQGLDGLRLRPRMDYFRFVGLLGRASFVVSDGGSNQEECHYLGKPLLLLRMATERQEGLGANALLSKLDPALVDEFMEHIDHYRQPPVQFAISPAERVARHLIEMTGVTPSR